MATVMTALQAEAWNLPFLDGTERWPRIEEPRRGWQVGLSVNL